MPSPRVSVIIPTHDRATLLMEAIGSVREQSFGDYEIIVCDDGSSDDTAERVRSLEGPILYVGLEHSGSLGRTRNRGIELARGELVAFLDDDDTWHPEKLARQVSALDAEPAAGVAYTDARLLFPDGSLSGPVLSPAEKRAGRLFSRLLRNCFFHPSTVMVRRQDLLRAGLFDEALYTGEDYDLWLRLARATREVCVPEPLVRIRRQPSSHSGRSGLRAYENAIRAVDRQLTQPDLPLADRLRCRACIARLHARAALAALEGGDSPAARRHALSSLRQNPLQRPAWSALRRSRSIPDRG